MKKYIFIFYLIVLYACQTKTKGTLYQDYSDKYYVHWKKSNRNGITDSIGIFYDFNSPTIVKQVGFYKNGFRNGYWNYNLKDTSIRINWGYYRDSTLDFETNLFSYIDYIKRASFFTKFEFIKDKDTVTLIVNVNGPFKDSLPEKNYEKITRNELKSIGVNVIYFSTKKATHSSNDIYFYTFEGEKKKKFKYVTGCYSFVDKNHFIEFSSASSKKNDPYSIILFNAVLTNFYINGKRLYNPFIGKAN